VPQPNKTFSQAVKVIQLQVFKSIYKKHKIHRFFLSVNPAFSKGVYRQYKLKIVEGLIIQPKIGLQFK